MDTSYPGLIRRYHIQPALARKPRTTASACLSMPKIGNLENREDIIEVPSCWGVLMVATCPLKHQILRSETLRLFLYPPAISPGPMIIPRFLIQVGLSSHVSHYQSPPLRLQPVAFEPRTSGFGRKIETSPSTKKNSVNIQLFQAPVRHDATLSKIPASEERA